MRQYGAKCICNPHVTELTKTVAMTENGVSTPLQIADVWREAQSHVIAEAELVGTYSR